MQFIDQKFRANAKRYIFQCGLATLAILLVLSFLNVFQQTTLIASLGASTFIAFAMPSSRSAQPRGLIGGYVLGTLVGVTLSLISQMALLEQYVCPDALAYTFFGATSVGITIFAMVVTNTEHPPAAGAALGLVLNPWNFITVVFILVSVIILAAIKHMLRPILIDLH